jgi:hypothetical protein
MSKGHKKASQERALVRLNPSSSASTELRSINDDPILIGPDNSVRVDLTKLTAPANVYDADYAWINHRPGEFSLFFAKRSLSRAEGLRTRLELRFPPESIVQLWPNTREFHDRVNKFIEKWPKNEDRDKIDPSKWDADRDHSEWANIETMAHSGTEASLDFYTLPASGIAKFMKGQGSSQLIVRPVVRVQMNIFELARLLESLASVVSDIKKYLPPDLINIGTEKEL